MKSQKFSIKRVDIQVLGFTASIVVLSCLCVFGVCYQIAYQDMLLSLLERVNSIYTYLEQEMDTSMFLHINTREDMQKDEYKQMKSMFADIKSATGVMYLYTAKQSSNGDFIYVIDGLPDSASDFRYPGDLIEEEIVPDLNRALSGKAVLPKDIKHTAWGDIFITYLPIHDQQDAVVGVIGIEFEAGRQYKTYAVMRMVTPLIILASCIVCALFAVLFFRRVSNPLYQDLSNTDHLTNLKNRNAYELDIGNIGARGAAAGYGIILSDLNGLKQINDTMGHEAGDEYIKAIALALQGAKRKNEILYRVGGDEFVILIPNTSEEELNAFVQRAQAEFSVTTAGIHNASAAMGIALCLESGLDALEEAYRKADANMYKIKNMHYKEKAPSDRA